MWTVATTNFYKIVFLHGLGHKQPLKVPALGAMLGGALTVHVLIN